MYVAQAVVVVVVEAVVGAAFEVAAAVDYDVASAAVPASAVPLLGFPIIKKRSGRRQIPYI